MSRALGLLAALGAALAFGVQYVPVKRHAIFDGATFQWFMCSGILLGGFCVSLASGDLSTSSCPAPVLLGGALWGLSNYAVLPLVKLLGIGLGFSLYHFVNLIVGYCTGRFGLFGVPRLQPKLSGDFGLYICDAGCIMVLVSFCAMLSIENGDGDLYKAPGLAARAPQSLLPASPGASGGLDAGEARSSAGGGGGGGGSLSGCNAADAESQCALGSDPPPADRCGVGGRPRLRRALGAALALVGGGLAGVQSVPATLYNNAHPGQSATAVVFPQCLGIWVSSTLLYVLYSTVAKMRGMPVPHSVIRPAFFSGVIWSVGFMLMIVGIRDLGYSVGYTLDAVGPIVVSSLLSIFVFREISGRRHLTVYLAAMLLQLVGSGLIAVFGAHT